jgi:hypothetical protein
MYKFITFLFIYRYELLGSEYVTKLPKGKHSTKGKNSIAVVIYLYVYIFIPPW